MAASRQQVIQTAEKLVARGRLQAAISEYRKVLEAAPNDTSMLNRVGDLYARLNQVDKATRLFRQTAENFARQGFFVKAIAIYKKIIRLDPSQIAAYESLAGLYARQGLTNESISQFQVVADYYVKHGDGQSAVGIYRNMIEIEQENPRYRLKLAGLLQEAGDASGALEQYHEIASLMLVHGRTEEAAQVYSSALDVDSTDSSFLVRASVALREAGNDTGSERLFDLVAERSPETAATARAELERLEAEARESEDRGEAERRRPFWMQEESTEEQAADDEGAEIEVQEAALEEADVEIEEVGLDEIGVDEAEDVSALELMDEEEGEGELVLDLDAPELTDPELHSLAGQELGVSTADEADEADEFEFELEMEPPVSAAAIEEHGADEAAVAEPMDEEEPALAAEALVVDLTAEPDATAAEEVAEPTESESDGEEAVAEAQEAAVEEDEPESEEVAAAAEDESVEQLAPGPETPDDRPTEISDRAAELLAEATVLSKYGMDEMAAACLEDTLGLDPDHVEAQGRLIHLQLSLGRRDEALIMANRFAELVSEGGEPEIWGQVVSRMEEEGFELEHGRFVATAVPEEEVSAAQASPADAEEETFEQPAEWAEELEEAARREAEAEAAAEAEEQERRAAEEKERLAAEERERDAAEERARQEAEEKARQEAEAKERLAAERRARFEEQERERYEAELALRQAQEAAAEEAAQAAREAEEAAEEAATAEPQSEEEVAGEAAEAPRETWAADGRGAVEVDTRRDILDIATAVRRRRAEGGRPAAATPGDLLAGAEELLWEGEETGSGPAEADAPPSPTAAPEAPPADTPPSEAPASEEEAPEMAAAAAQEGEAPEVEPPASVPPAKGIDVPPGLDLEAMARELEAAAERFAASLGPAVPPGMEAVEEAVEEEVAEPEPAESPKARPSVPPQAETDEQKAAKDVAWSDGDTMGADEFFDLATELEAELLEAELEDDLLPPVQEQTIEEIVEGFRKGMQKSLAPEDFDTHYNLGIAYQEMGLLDEAIGEFQLAAKDPRYLVECCSLLAGCFQTKGYPELAVHWYELGLASPSIREDERLGLLYELGNLELAVDERERARERFVEIYGINSTYRDVVAKLEELGRRPS